MRGPLSKNATNFDFLSDSFQIYQLGFDAAWELDFWGRYRRGIESAKADLIASIAGYDAVLVSLTAEVARSYILTRAFEERMTFAMNNVEIQRRSLSIAEAQYKSGAVSKLDVQQAKAVLNDTLALIPELETGLHQARNALSKLLGMSPGGIDAHLGSSGKIPQVSTRVAVEMPADLLRRRPDVKEAELQAAAQSAIIGIAKADLFPTIALAGTIGLSKFDSNNINREGNDFFDSDSLSYRYGIGFTWPIFNYGRIKNSVRVQDARLQQLLVNYQDTVNQAAREVEDALTAFLRSQERTQLLANSVDAYKLAVDLSLIQYREGLIDYQRVLDTLRFLTRQQDALTETSSNVALDLISVYKAVGGGWQIRQGKDFVDAENKEQMRDRTGWGKLMENMATEAAAVIDHHPHANKKYKSLNRDVRPRSAFCATIVTEYLREQSMRLDTKLATALFLGASTDIAKQPILTSADQRAARYIAKDVDFNLVLAIQNVPYPRSLYRRLSDALQLVKVIGDTAVCFGAAVDSPAAMAVLADFIARCEGLNSLLITATINDNYFITVRSRFNLADLPVLPFLAT